MQHGLRSVNIGGGGGCWGVVCMALQVFADDDDRRTTCRAKRCYNMRGLCRLIVAPSVVVYW